MSVEDFLSTLKINGQLCLMEGLVWVSSSWEALPQTL
jgi:hypothetical protein